MRRATITAWAAASVLGALAVIAAYSVVGGTLASDSPPASRSTGAVHAGLLYGRVTTTDGITYEGRLRFGGGRGRDEEALWGNYFNGRKDGNPWVDPASLEQSPRERFSMEIFGIEVALARPYDLSRPFMARLGDIARIDARGRDLRVTLKSGTVVELDRYEADDFADGVRVWDGTEGVVDLHERRIRTIEFQRGAVAGSAGPYPLFGTVRTRQGEFSGLVQWDRQACVGSDELAGRSADGEISIRFDEMSSIVRSTGEGALVRLVDGREVALTHTRRDGRANRGMYVDDPRYGRVLISWGAFERVDFSPGGTGPAYTDFPPGHPLTGSVATRSGVRLAGRLVFDLDESETTETLDAPSGGVDYTILFGLIASIEPLGAEGARVTFHDGEALRLEAGGDLAATNAGMLIFAEGAAHPRYVPWGEVGRVQLDRPPAMDPTSASDGA